MCVKLTQFTIQNILLVVLENEQAPKFGIQMRESVIQFSPFREATP